MAFGESALAGGGEMNDLVKRLREAGSIGLDLSPGNLLSMEAAVEIERLLSALRKFGKHEPCKCAFSSRGERIPSSDCELDKILGES